MIPVSNGIVLLAQFMWHFASALLTFRYNWP